VTGNYFSLPQITESDLKVTSFDRKSPGGDGKLTYTVHFTLYKAVARSKMQSCCGKRCRDLR